MANLLTPFPRIFMSHSTKDNDFGLQLASDLRQIIGDQEAVWFDALGSLHGVVYVGSQDHKLYAYQRK